MIRINLLPVRAAQKKEKLVSQVVVLVLVLVLALTACGFVHFTLAGKVKAQKAENDKIQTELNSLRKKIGQVGQFKERQKELRGKLDVLQELKAARTGPVHLLDELTMALPEKAWLNSFRESGGTISIEGIGLNEETVATFMESLEISPYYKNVELQVIEQRNQGGNKLHSFSLTARADYPQAEKTD
ncbi:MAG: PilN domain-containing protein [Desulfuromonadales bacterium]